MLITQALTNIITAIVADRMYPEYKPQGNVDKKQIKRINQRIKDLFTSKIGSVIYDSADTIVISSFLGLTVLAVYQNYFYILNAITGFITIIFNSCTAGIGNSLVVETKEKNFKDLKKFSFIICWIAGICTVCLLCLYQPFMELWVGKELMLSFYAVICFSIYFFIRQLNGLLNLYKDASGMWHEDRYRPLIAALTNLILNIILVRKPEYRGAKDFLLKGKVRCGNCHRSLAYTDGGIHPKIYCPHKAQAGRYSHCSEDAYPVSVIEGHIWYSLKRILRILDSVQRESEEKYTDNSFTGKRQQRVLESELEKLKNERIHQYEAYAEGVLSREKYITVKKQLTETIEKIQSEQKALASVIIEEERYRSRIRTAVQQLEVQIERGKLTKEIIDTMIDTVYVYDKKRIEVILRFDDVLQKVISEYMEGAKGA